MFAAELTSVFLLLMPVILAGIANMIFVKSSFCAALQAPIDGHCLFRDGKPWFGKNKTWKGFWGMIVFCSLSFLGMDIWADVWHPLHSMSLLEHNSLSWLDSWLLGACCGLGYVLFELPNSFVKRRFDVPPGRNIGGVKGAVFNFFDQADSVLGCMLFLALFLTADAQTWVSIFVIATLTHYAMNILLFGVKLKSSPW